MTNLPVHPSPAVHRLKRGRPPADSAARYKELVRHAEEVFLERGLSQTSMDDIAARAKVSKRTLYEFFPNKREIFRSVITEQRSKIMNLSAVEGSPDPETALCNVFIDDGMRDGEDAQFDLFKLVYDEAAENSEIRDIVFEAGRKPAVLALAQWFAAHDFLKEQDPEVSASILLDMILGFVNRKELFEMTTETYVAHVRRSVSIFVNGIAAVQTDDNHRPD